MGILKRFMHFLSTLMPVEGSEENSRAVKVFYNLLSFKDSFFFITGKKNQWPAVPGYYQVGDRNASIAICTLTSNQLVKPLARIKGVAIAGRIYTPNLGIEKMIQNITSNPQIRYLLICGKESSVFHPGQAIHSLFKYGVSSKKRILHATGHYPVLGNITTGRIETFLQQVELVDWTGETDLEVLKNKIKAVARHPITAYKNKDLERNLADADKESMTEKFKEIKIGGKRSPDPEDRKGFFVITVDQKSKLIVVKHYDIAHQPGYLIKGHSAQSILHALLRENLISELSHAGYLGAELAKAEASLKLNLVYEQDRPLRKT
jgi:tetrahydromethanopterin S-methyltransferase subunit A